MRRTHSFAGAPNPRNTERFGDDGGGRGGGGRGRGGGGRGGGRSTSTVDRRRSNTDRASSSSSPSSATFFSSDSFEAAGASPELVDALSSLGIGRPSHIQAAALRAMLPKKITTPSISNPSPSPPEHLRSCVLADHAGSGKTLAYLVPLVMDLRLAEAAVSGGGPLSRPGAPSALVVAPTSELCAQVLRVARGLARAGGAPFRSVALTGGHPWRTQRDALAEGADLVVATPGRLGEHVRAGGLSLSRLRTVVLDEADVLLGEEASDGSSGLLGGDAGPGGASTGPSAFHDQVSPLRELAPADAAFVLVTATLPEPTWERVAREFPGIAPVLGPGLHRTAPGVEQVLVDCSSPDDGASPSSASSSKLKEGEEEEPRNAETAYLRKADALLKVLANHPANHTVVFCNRVETCRKIENLINRKLKQSHVALPYHAAVERRAREGALAAFTGNSSSGGGSRRGGGGGAEAAAAASNSLASEKKMVLVATDRASRGLDTSAVGHAVLFDFPRDPSEYVRRAGRVARGAARGGAGGDGDNATTATVTLLVLGRQVPVARAVVERGAAGLPVHRVPAP